FGKLLAAGLATSLAVQTWVILAGVTKLIPLTGITLPFFSYGGTSLVVNLALIGMVFKVAEQPVPAPASADADGMLVSAEIR
ncbi:MAG TPA: FtsW/RodA/SpoVE family cell cycle protein, partial [Armatimonadota bacterium]